MSSQQYAEIASAEVLVFEITDERFFGFVDADMAAIGAGISAADARATAATALVSAGLAELQAVARAVGNADVAAAGSAAMAIEILAVEKKSADVLMAGMAGWMATGITFTPHSVLNEDAVRRPPEARSMRRPRPVDASARAAEGRLDRTEEHRELVR